MIARNFKVMTNLMEEDNNDSLDSSDPGAVLDRGKPSVLERRDSIRPTVSDWGGRQAPTIKPGFAPQLSGVRTDGPPPRVTAPLIPPPTTQPLPPPFIEPASSRTRTVAPGEMASPEFSSPAGAEVVVFSPTDQIPTDWTSLMIQRTDGSGRTLHVDNEDALVENGLQQLQVTVNGSVREVIVPIGIASEGEIARGVRKLIRSVFVKFPEGFSLVFRTSGKPQSY